MQHLVAVADADQAESPMSNHPPALQRPAWATSGWDQPSSDSIEIDDMHALMTRATFEALPEYSSTIPTGVYPGKMWRRNDARNATPYSPLDPPVPPDWLLCWYEAQGAGCAVQWRKVLLV
jgi:hypothetical protein